jgi:SAM-dependent methyltransferase
MVVERFLRWLRFNSWYFYTPPWDTGIAPPELREFITSHPPGRALDLGCGTGTNLVELGRAGWKVMGVDFAIRAVLKARARLQQAGLEGEVIAEDVTRLEWLTDPFELILDIGCFHGVASDSRVAYQRNIKRLLKKGGTFLLYAHLRDLKALSVGITETEIERLVSDYKLTRREDSQDRWGRNAAWLWFELRE